MLWPEPPALGIVQCLLIHGSHGDLMEYNCIEKWELSVDIDDDIDTDTYKLEQSETFYTDKH